MREALARQRKFDESWAAVQLIQKRVADGFAASGERVPPQAEMDDEMYDEFGLALIIDSSAIVAVLLDEPVSVEQGMAVKAAAELFGRPRHRAKLNYGDCFS